MTNFLYDNLKNEDKVLHILSGFINLGYDDYIASRQLLNNGLYSQGATLATYAVERYIKNS